MCRACRFAVMQARLSRQRLGFQPSCAQNRLAQNQNCIRLGLDRFSEVPLKVLENNAAVPLKLGSKRLDGFIMN